MKAVADKSRQPQADAIEPSAQVIIKRFNSCYVAGFAKKITKASTRFSPHFPHRKVFLSSFAHRL